MNSVMNPVTSYGFSSSQTTLGTMGRGYGASTPASMAQRPSFAIQELLGLGASQLGSGQHQGFPSPHQLFQNDTNHGAVSYPYQNFPATSSPPMQSSAMTACHGGVMDSDFGAMNAMYNPSWRPGLIPNAAAYPRDDVGMHSGRSLCTGSESSLSPNDKQLVGQHHQTSK